MSELEFGLYEKIIDLHLQGQLKAAEEAGAVATRDGLEQAESHIHLARHVEVLLRDALRQVGTGDDRLPEQRALVNEVVEVLRGRKTLEHLGAHKLIGELERLLEVRETTPDSERLPRPVTPLSDSSLFTGSRGEPTLASEIKAEILSADQVDVLVSFVKWSGIRLLAEALKEFTSREGTRLRVITTSYIGATEAKAVEFLASLPHTEVRVSYDTKITRLHAKAYLFLRRTGFHTAYVGSSNLSNPAMTEGLEWNLKVSAQDSPHILDKIRATFTTYWEDRAFRAFDGSVEDDRRHLRSALAEARGDGEGEGGSLAFFDLRPYDYQEEILERLAAARVIHGRRRNLVVAATGTGKTVVAAFDYRRFCEEARQANPAAPCRMLFVAHREEILKQSLHTFRCVLRDANFGSLLTGFHEPSSLDYLFVTVQSLGSRELLRKLPADQYDYIVIDEFHHAAAQSYRELLDHCEPKVLLGLTATPERADGLPIVELFGGEIDAEIRLPEAIQRRLLAPFHYFGISDTLDLSSLQWKRGGYDMEELDKVVTGNDIRAGLVLDSIDKYVGSPKHMRAVCFCVSQAHAAYMAKFFTARGLPAESLDANSPRELRASVRQRLQRREINVICVVDLYNEGVDIPEMDTVLFLRPTESLTVYLQQLGRGLRIHPDKECLTVLDFIGQAHRKFRFAPRFRALLGQTHRSVEKEIESGFPHLPAGCFVQLERVAQEYVLENIRQARLRSRRDLVGAVARWYSETTRDLTLVEFLKFHDLTLADLYRNRMSWSRLLHDAGMQSEFDPTNELPLAQGLARLKDANGRHYLETCLSALEAGPEWVASASELQKRQLLMFHYTVWSEAPVALGMRTLADSVKRIMSNVGFLSEFKEVVRILLHRIDHVDRPLQLPYACPLELHSNYTREEILAGLGVSTFDKQAVHREGVKYIPTLQTDVLLVTLNKVEGQFSPTTMYEDYAVSRDLFHWQSQSTTSEASPTGRRYVHHRSRGNTVLLFVREESRRDRLGARFTFLGPVSYVSHEGSRPMSILWRLQTPMPASMWSAGGKLAVGA